MKKGIFLILTLCLLLTGCGKDKEEINNGKLNTNENVVKEQVVNSLTMNNVELSYKDGTSTFTVDVVNNSSNSISINQFDVVFKTENGSDITTLTGSLENSINSGDSLEVVITSDIDLTNAYSVEYIIK